MPNFEMLEKKKPAELEVGDHIIYRESLWRIYAKHRLLGYPNGFMLMIAPHHLIDPKGFVFHEIKDENRIEVFRLMTE